MPATGIRGSRRSHKHRPPLCQCASITCGSGVSREMDNATGNAVAIGQRCLRGSRRSYTDHERIHNQWEPRERRIAAVATPLIQDKALQEP